MKQLLFFNVFLILFATNAQHPVSVPTTSYLANQKGINNTSRYVNGKDSANDGKGGMYYWNSSSTLTHDGYNVIARTGVSTGRWLRANPSLSRDSTMYHLNRKMSRDTSIMLFTDVNARISGVEEMIPDALSQLYNDVGYITAENAPVTTVNGGGGDVVLFIPTNTNQLTNGAGFITGINSSMVTTALGFTPISSEVDGSVTNEIELPSRTGNNGKFLSTDGTNVSWSTPSITETDPTVSAASKAITSGDVTNWNSAYNNSGKSKVYDKNGLISSVGITMVDTFTISSATPTISFSSFMSATSTTSFKIKGVTGFRVGASATNSPQVSVTGLTSNSVSLVASQNNTAVVTILGINVLSGQPMIPVPDPQNIKIVISAVFY